MKAAPPWKGTLKVSAKQKERLLAIPLVTEELLKDSHSSIEYVAYWAKQRSGVMKTEDRKRLANKDIASAAIVRAFRELVTNDAFIKVQLLAPQIERGATISEANLRFDALIADLHNVESYLEAFSKRLAPKRGIKTNEDEAHLIWSLAISWRHVVGKTPGREETSPFLRYAEEVGRLCGLSITAAKIKKTLARSN